MTNYFTGETTAKRYARSRPYFHPVVVARIREFLQIRTPLATALDVACGTGQSTTALKSIASRIVGMDISPEMIAEAPPDPDITYLISPAEQINLSGATFDLITVCMALHWLERSEFLSEAQRLLYPGGWLVIYQNFFFGAMKDNPEFERWNQLSYLPRYPTPPRNDQPFTDGDAARYGFSFVKREDYTNDVTFTLDQLASYLMTQSNVIAVFESGQESADSVYTWLLESLRPLFSMPKGTFHFGGYIWFLRKGELPNPTFTSGP